MLNFWRANEFFRISKTSEVFALNLFLSILLIINTGVLHAVQTSQALFDKALVLSRDGDLIEALDTWNQFLEVFPEDPLAFSNRGNVKFALGDFEGAIIDQSESIDLFPSAIDSHLNRGIAEEALQLWNEAAMDYSWVIERAPDNSQALYNLGNVMVSQENWSDARTYFSQASLTYSQFPIASSSKALMDFQLGQLEIAEKELRTIIRRNPMFADARAALTALLWHKGSFGEAESHWAAVAGLDIRYKNKDWLLTVRRWPPEPTNDLLAFLDL